MNLRFKPIRLIPLVTLALLTACQSPFGGSPRVKDGQVEYITVLHTNDHHGRFWHNRYGEYGLAARKTLIDQLRQAAQSKGHMTLLLSGGDINTGVPESDIQDAEPDFKGMQRIGYDAMAVGNHEFDNPLAVIKKQQSWVKFPFLSANIYDKASGKRLFQPYEIFETDSVRVAVLGLTTDDTIRIGNPEYLNGIEFRSPIQEAKALVPELRKKVDVVIAVTHMGHYQNAQHGSNAPGDVSLARAVNGIDVIIGGHSQEPVCMSGQGEGLYDTEFAPGADCQPDKQNGTWIMQAHEWGKYVGKAEIKVSEQGRELIDYSLIPVNLTRKKTDAQGNELKDEQGNTQREFIGGEIKHDAELHAFLQPYQEKGEAGLGEVAGQVDERLVGDRDQVRFKPTNLGFLVAEAQRVKANADVAVMNSGGIRASLEAGDITYKDLLTVQPFGNTLGVLTLSGEALMAYLRTAAAMPVDTGAYAQFAGVELQIKDNTLLEATIKGQRIEPERNYRLALNSFLASGGDGYPKMDNNDSWVNTGFVDADVLLDYLKEHTPLKARDYAPSQIVRQ